MTTYAPHAHRRHAADAPPAQGSRGTRACVREHADETYGRGVRSPVARFPLGRVLATPGALAALDEAERLRGHGARRGGPTGTPARPIGAELLARHVAGDWGDVCAADRAANDAAVASGERILSAYALPTGVRLWLITEADRSATTILTPDEY